MKSVLSVLESTTDDPESLVKAYTEIRKILVARAKESENNVFKILEINDWDVSEMVHTDVLDYLISIHTHMSLFRSDKLIQVLKKFNLKEQQTRWFISLDKIEEQFSVINKKGIEVNKLSVLSKIKLYLFVKFYSDLQFYSDAFVIDDGVVTNGLSKTLLDFKARYKYRNNKDSAVKSEKDRKFIEFLKRMGGWEIFESDMDLAILFAKGKVEKVLFEPLIMSDFIYDKSKISQIKFLSGIYDLFQIFLLEYNLEDYNAFLDKNLKENRYEVFQANRLKMILFAKKSKKG